MVTKTYDSAKKSFVTASPPTVIGTKKPEMAPITPRGKVNMISFKKPETS